MGVCGGGRQEVVKLPSFQLVPNQLKYIYLRGVDNFFKVGGGGGGGGLAV